MEWTTLVIGTWDSDWERPSSSTHLQKTWEGFYLALCLINPQQQLRGQRAKEESAAATAAWPN